MAPRLSTARTLPWLLRLATLLAVLGVSKFHAAFVGHYVFHTSARLPWALALAGLLSLAAYAAGLPDDRRGPVAALLPATLAAGGSATVMSLAELIVGQPVLPRMVIGVSAAVSVGLYTAGALVAGRDRASRRGRERVLAVVGADDAAALAVELALADERPASLACALSPEELRGDPGERPLSDAARRSRATVVVLGRDAQLVPTIVAEAAVLHRAGVRVRTLERFYDEWLGKTPVSELEQMSLLFDIREVHGSAYPRFKRICDVTLAAAGCLVLAPTAAAVAVLNRLGNRGPLLYRQPRVGKGGRQFTILKFRTMHQHADTEPARTEWTREDDPRITPLGRWLRRTHVDELPQLLNVLRGDLSIVGPRPEQPGYVAALEEKLAFYDTRHLVRPGLTGWAQVNYRYGATDSDALEKLQYDFYYLRHQSLSLDLRILGRTARHLLRDGGR